MNKKTIVVASSNKGKIREIKEIFKDYEVLPIKKQKKDQVEKQLLKKNKILLKIMLQKKSGTYLPKLEKIIFVQLMTLEYQLTFQPAFQEFTLLVGWLQTIIQRILNYLKKQELHQKKKELVIIQLLLFLKVKPMKKF